MKKAFTLVELVIVVAIFGVIFIVISGTFLNSLKAALKAEATKEVRQNGDVAMARLVNDIKSAQAGSFQCLSEISGAETNPDDSFNKRLVLTDPDGIQWVYYRNGGGALMRWREPWGSPVPPNPSPVPQFLVDRESVWIPPDNSIPGSQNSLNFDCTDVANGAIGIELTIQYVPFGNTALINSARSEEQVEMKFETTVVNRNT